MISKKMFLSFIEFVEVLRGVSKVHSFLSGGELVIHLNDFYLFRRNLIIILFQFRIYINLFLRNRSSEVGLVEFKTFTRHNFNRTAGAD